MTKFILYSRAQVRERENAVILKSPAFLRLLHLSDFTHQFLLQAPSKTYSPVHRLDPPFTPYKRFNTDRTLVRLNFQNSILSSIR